MARRFEDLEIWQEARNLSRCVYQLAGLNRQLAHDYGFKNQICRASVSVMNNIAEGFERSSKKDFAHFLDIAKASAGEVRSMLWLAEDLEYIERSLAQEYRSNYERLSRQIASLSKRLRGDI